MTKIIESVPDSITREDYTRLIESVGFDVKWLISLKFDTDGIRARVVSEGPDGNAIHAPTDDDEFAIACDDIFIPVADEVTA